MTNRRTESAAGLPPAGSALLRALLDNWGLVLLRGVVAIAFGAAAFAWPGLILLMFTYLWGAYALDDGIFALWAVTTGRGGEMVPRWPLVLFGAASILAGLLTFFWPGLTPPILLMFIAAWALATGVLQIWLAIQVRKEIESEWMLALAGLLSIACGLYLITQPDMGAKAVVWSISWFSVLVGCTYVALAFRLRRHLTHAT
jgi:uncharacterized membrane protein HdeD (DUF308 family)